MANVHVRDHSPQIQSQVDSTLRLASRLIFAAAGRHYPTESEVAELTDAINSIATAATVEERDR
jgi:hypothetical protein